MAGPEDEGFKVTDRRRRTDDEEAAPVAAMPQPPTEPPPEPRTQDAPGRQPVSEAAPRPSTSAAAERDLSGLFIMLASSAALALGEAPEPGSGRVHQDLAQAADLIDLLVLLREKTEGHRTAEESQVLEELIYDLQLRYVAATRRSGSSPGPARA